MIPRKDFKGVSKAVLFLKTTISNVFRTFSFRLLQLHQVPQMVNFPDSYIPDTIPHEVVLSANFRCLID